VGAGNFSLHHHIQNGSGAHPASYPMGTRGSFPGGKSGRYVKLTTHLHLVPKSRIRGAIPPLPQHVCMAWCLVKHKDNFTFTFIPFLSTAGFKIKLHKIYDVLFRIIVKIIYYSPYFYSAEIVLN
jgi:hypothetical protein